MGRKLLQQAPADAGVAGPHLTRQLDEPAALPDAVEEVGERLLMALAHVEEARVRRDREGRFLQGEMGQVHRVSRRAPRG